MEQAAWIYQGFDASPGAPDSGSRSRGPIRGPKVLLAGQPAGNLGEDARDEIITLPGAMWPGPGPLRGLAMPLP
jgi:hypothetical protein